MLVFPPGVFTSIFPDVPSSGWASMSVEEMTLKDLAGLPPKVTEEVLLKPIPLRVIVS